MLQRRNYRRTRSDETDIRSATREELSGAMAGTPRSGTNDCRSQSGGHERTGPQAAATISVAEAVATAAAKWGGNNSRPVAVDHDDDDDGGGGQYDDGGLGDDGRHGDDRRHRQLVTPSASCRSTPLRHNPSVGSADTEMTSLDTRELWLPDTEPTPSTMSALHQFGAEMLRLSRGLEKVASPDSKPASPDRSYRLSGDDNDVEYDMDDGLDDELDDDLDDDLLDEESGGGGVPFTDGGCDSICSEEVTGTPRCRRVKRQRRRRRRRSGTLHESMRRRFDGHGHRYPPPHPYFRHPHQQKNHLQSPHHTDSRPTRVRSFHEDELRRNRIESPVIVTTEDNIETIAVTGPKIVGTLLKQEYQRKPGLEEEICLLPPPPRRRRRRCSASTSSGDTTGTPSPHPTPRWPVEQTPPPLAREPTHQPQQLTAAQPDNQPKRHDMLQQTAVAATRRADTIAEWSAVANTSKTTLVVDCGKGGLPLRRAMTQKLIRKRTLTMSTPSGKRHSPLMRYGSTLGLPASQQQQHQTSPMTSLQRSTNNNNSRSSVMIRNSYRHGRIIRLEQKATKVLGVVFFTFVFLWTPFFALNLLPSVCPNCEANTNKGLIDLVTWLGYASSMVNPVFYTIFNKVFRQAFKRVLLCKYRGRNKRHSWPPPPPIRKV
ncbi:G protein-coupled receptor, rhodopsin-like,GPCR, rhodopsin-like, 7TM [Cinara cedri]|uniref:G protein-coupled receptor, rhodopsin-like,GPCR, rhodopsin-like, 7TM n=1 Tax=Cinara cedri TaxID=506608 RepID=A0A5E4MAW5_9HEMI|nr:G protein-coupled receptor, rhodopsin-like,GPCR, rhodopsin-like, 7TM [Cinara cedri]